MYSPKVTVKKKEISVEFDLKSGEINLLWSILTNFLGVRYIYIYIYIYIMKLRDNSFKKLSNEIKLAIELFADDFKLLVRPFSKVAPRINCYIGKIY